MNQDWVQKFKCLYPGLVISNLHAVLPDMTTTEEFFRRRRVGRTVAEFQILARGIRSNHGLTRQYICPVTWLLFRLMPQGVIKQLYRGGLR